MADVLPKHREVWNRKRLLRLVYTEWYHKVLAHLKPGRGLTVELGAGTGNFKEFKPDIISSDIELCPWLDACFDAHHMPFAGGSLSNIVLIDVLHHLSNPMLAFREAARVLKPGGRIVILEPYPTFFSSIVYRLVHPEPFIYNVDYFSKAGVDAKDPWASNQAIACLLFFRQRERFEAAMGQHFRIIERHRLSCILYPLSGGFEKPALVPDFLVPAVRLLETLLHPLRWLLAFRCFVVLEKRG